MIKIRFFKSSDTQGVINLVLGIQNDGTRKALTVEDQPDLKDIEEKYFKSGGAFWIAHDGEKIVGCIGLMLSGKRVGILKKFFVNESYRGYPHYLGTQLYARLFTMAKELSLETLVLDTPKNATRAHAFYEKAGFKKIEYAQLPIEYSYTYEDSDFFQLDLN